LSSQTENIIPTTKICFLSAEIFLINVLVSSLKKLRHCEKVTKFEKTRKNTFTQLHKKVGDFSNFCRLQKTWTSSPSFIKDTESKKFLPTLGKVQRHTIQQRASATKIQEVVNSEMEKKDIGKTDLITPLSTTISKPLISQVKEKPELLLIKQPHDASNPHEMIATLKLPKILSKDELLLELGPDRLLLQSDMYLLDIFLPFNIYPEQSTAEFHRDERHLKVQMKVSKNLLWNAL
jgi:hypothetical protein